MFKMFKAKRVLKLEGDIKNLNEKVTYLNDVKAESDIALARLATRYRVDIENIQSSHKIEVAQISADLQELREVMDAEVEARTTQIENSSLKELESSKADYRKFLKTEMNGKVEGLEKSNKALETESSKNKGLYDGALLVIKALESQLATANNLNKTLVEAMPEVKANLNAGNQNVSVNAKS